MMWPGCKWLAFWLLFASAEEAWQTKEVFVPLPKGGKVGLSTRGTSAFRVRLIAAHDDREPIMSPMIGPDGDDVAFQVDRSNDGVGIVAPFGIVKITSEGALMLFNAAGHLLTASDALAGSATSLALSTNQGVLYGSGASPDDCQSLTATSATPQVCNRATYTPYYFCTDGYGALGAVEFAVAQKLPVSYRNDGVHVTWEFKGSLDLYLMPAPTLREGSEAYYALIGSPRVPPRYAFGFMASRWGWQGRAYAEDTVNRFRSDKYPIDGIIFDFEWFTKESDYTYSPQGKDWYQDFGYNPATFDEPAKQLAKFASMNIRVGGIRKPRLGNTDLLNMARSKNWILEAAEPGGAWPPDFGASYAKDRCLDFAQPAVREWYAKNMAHFTEEGMSFWWNDEGETDYYTFHWWNVAQIQALREKSHLKRFYSLNRAWSPGMARLGATVWTGDINPTWKDLQGTPGMMLNWVLGGAPYVSCDIGGFTGETQADLLSRWMQVGVFLPSMRVHSTLEATPHWPWLWGEQAANTMRRALEMRYRLVPYHYSLAHAMFTDRKLWMRPLLMDWPNVSDTWSITEQWMDGDILVAPVLRKDSVKQVYLPPGIWYPLAASQINPGHSSPIQGPQHIRQGASADEVPAFAPAGAVLPLAPVVQSTAELPGGPLEVQVYAGADGTFSLVEDDGETTSYEAGQVRTTTFIWNDRQRRLTWTLRGYLFAPGARAFESVFVTLVEFSGTRRSDVYPLGIVGAIDLSERSAFI